MPTPLTIDPNRIKKEGRTLALRQPGFDRTYQELGRLASGRVLEIGYGLGFLHAQLHANPNVSSIEILEKEPSIAATITCGCPVHIGDWRDYDFPARYSTIIYDVFDGKTDGWGGYARDVLLSHTPRVIRFNHADNLVGHIEVHV